MNKGSGTCGIMTKDVAFIIVEFRKEKRKRGLKITQINGRVWKKTTAHTFKKLNEIQTG